MERRIRSKPSDEAFWNLKLTEIVWIGILRQDFLPRDCACRDRIAATTLGTRRSVRDWRAE